MYGLFLDDERNPEDVTWIKYPDNVEWIVVRDSSEFFQKFHELHFQDNEFFVSFDHDIQEIEYGSETTGYDILKIMLNIVGINSIPVPVCYFHTQNPIGKENMEMYYKNFVEFYKKRGNK